MDFILSLPSDQSAYPTALDNAHAGERSVDLFHRWAFALLDKRAPFNPPFDLIAMRIIDASSPGTTELRGDRFAVNYGRVKNFALKPGNRAFLQVDGIDAFQMG